MRNYSSDLAKIRVKGLSLIEKGKKPSRDYFLALEGRKYFNFAWPVKEYYEFIDLFCDENKKPNEAIWELITEAVKNKKILY